MTFFTQPWYRLALLAGCSLTSALNAQAQAPAWQTALSLTGVPPTATTLTYALVQASAADAAGNVYVAGSFGGTLTLGATTLRSPGGGGLFVAKWNRATQAYVWAQQFTSTQGGEVTGLAVGSTGLYLAGSFYGTATLGPLTLTNSVASGTTTDIFVAKLTEVSNTASFTWAQAAGGAGNDRLTTLAIADNALYVGGYFTGPSATFGATTLTNANPTGADTDNRDSFVAKLTDQGPAGRYAWGQRLGSALFDQASSVAVVGRNVYVAGSFAGTASVGTSRLVSAGQTDGYVARLTDQGSTADVDWAQRVGGAGNDALAAVAVTTGSVYVAGLFEGTATFGSTPLVAQGGTDAVVARLADGSGTVTWALPAGGPNNDEAAGLAASTTGVYVTGHFNRYGLAADASPATFGASTLVAAGNADAYVARLQDAGATGRFAWVQVAGGPGNDYGLYLTLGAGNVYVAGYTYGRSVTFGNTTVRNDSYDNGTPAGLLGVLADIPLAVHRPTALLALAVYPNPARAQAMVRVPTGAGPTTLTLLDALGRVVRTARTEAGQPYPLDLTGLVPGVYALRAQASEAQAIHQLVIE